MDAGIAMGRFQTANDTGSGDVVNYNAQGLYLTGTVASGSNSVTVINLGQTLNATQVSNLPGSWIKVVDPANSGVIMTRRIKSVTSAGIATIWATADNTGPTETTDPITYGRDFTNVPTNTMTYSIYSPFEIVWVESPKRFRLGSTPIAANTLEPHQTSVTPQISSLKNRLDALVATKLLRKARHPVLDLNIYNYTETVQFKNEWTEETKMSRGLVVNDDGRVIARPFKKFFNLAQKGLHDAYQKFANGEDFQGYDKLDGSLGILFWYNNQWVFASRGSFTSPQAFKGKELLFQYHNKAVSQLRKECTYVFEIIYAENKIVVDYGSDEKLILLTVIITDSDYTEIELETEAKRLSIPFATNYKSELNKIKSLDELYDVPHQNGSREGFVVKFNDGERVKIKFTDYVELHKIKTGFRFGTIYDTLGEGKSLLDIVDMIPDEYHQICKEIQKKATLLHAETVLQMQKIVEETMKQKINGASMKEIAATVDQILDRIPKPFVKGDVMKAVALNITNIGEQDVYRHRIYQYFKSTCDIILANKGQKWTSIPSSALDKKEHTEPWLQFMVGPAGSGKTSHIKENTTSYTPGTIVISRDTIRKMFISPDNSEQIQVNETTVSQIFDAILKVAVNEKRNIIIDNTNLRQSYITSIAAMTGYTDIRFQIMTTDKNTCIQRNQLRGSDNVPRNIVERQFNEMQNLLKTDFQTRNYTKFEDQIDENIRSNETDSVLATAYIFDMDGTLALHVSRSPFQEHKVYEDAVNKPISEILSKLAKTDKIIVLTGRTEGCKNMTLKWLKDKMHFEPDEIHFRKIGDKRKDYIVKEEMWKDVETRFRILAMFDDRDSVVKHARMKGYTVAQVAFGDF